MKTITMLVATAALVTAIAAANAQGTTKQMDEQAGGNSGAESQWNHRRHEGKSFAVHHGCSGFTEDASGER